MKGFTLVEILVVMAILSVLLGLGLFMSIDSYRAYISRSEQSTIVSLLQNARSRAMANIYQTSWGICYDAAHEQYITFRGAGYVAGAATNEALPASADVAIATTPDTFACTAGSGVSFAQLSGTSSAISLSITQQGRTESISVNNEGTIIW